MQLIKIFRLALLLGLLSAYTAFAQVITPTKLSTTVSKTALKVGDEVELIVNARIQDTWHLYATDFDPDLGPTVFSFNFPKSPAYELIGAPKSVGAEKHYDDVFKGNVTYFEKTGTIRQRVRVLQPGSLTIKADVEYQSCTDVDGRCIPGNETLSFGPLEITGTAVTPTTTPASPSQGAQGATTPAAAATTASGSVPAQAATTASPSDTAAQATTAPAAGKE